MSNFQPSMQGPNFIANLDDMHDLEKTTLAGTVIRTHGNCTFAPIIKIMLFARMIVDLW